MCAAMLQIWTLSFLMLRTLSFGCLKLADFGSAFKETDPDCEPTPYLVSRWYRAPEVVLGLEYDRAIDMWSVAVTLYELYTGVSMFPGRNNNEMLFMMMEYKGAFPNRIIKQHLRQFEKIPGIRPHFADDLRFMLQEPDPVTGQPKVRMVAITAPTKTLKQALLQGNSGSDSREAVIQLADLLEKCLLLDPRRRMTVTDALQHPFLKME
jgi:serine/threonine-protein kinase PRP4